MSYDKRLDVKLALSITDQSQPFNSVIVEWFDVPYAGVLEIQKNLLVFLNTMNQLGYEVDKVGGMNPPPVTPPLTDTPPRNSK